MERDAGNAGKVWVGGGRFVGAGLSRTRTGEPAANDDRRVNQCGPPCIAAAKHAVCKSGEMGKRSDCGTPESERSQDRGSGVITKRSGSDEILELREVHDWDARQRDFCRQSQLRLEVISQR